MPITSGFANVVTTANTTYRTVYSVIGGTAAASQTISTGFTNAAGPTFAGNMAVTRLQWSIPQGPSDYININWGGTTPQTIAVLSGNGSLDLKTAGMVIPNGASGPNGTIVVQQSASAPPYFVMIEVQNPYSGIPH
jgi:hypothetical protein